MRWSNTKLVPWKKPPLGKASRYRTMPPESWKVRAKSGPLDLMYADAPSHRTPPVDMWPEGRQCQGNCELASSV